MVMYNRRHILAIQVVLHHCSIRALGKLSALLYSTLVEDASHGELTVLSLLVRLLDNLFARHDKGLDCRLGKLVLNLFLELD